MILDKIVAKQVTKRNKKTGLAEEPTRTYQFTFILPGTKEKHVITTQENVSGAEVGFTTLERFEELASGETISAV